MQSLPQHILRRGTMYIKGTSLLIDNFSVIKKFDETKTRFLHSDLDEIEKRFIDTLRSTTYSYLARRYLNELLKTLCEFIETEFLVAHDHTFKTLCEAEKMANWHLRRQDLVTISTCRHLQIEQNERYSLLLSRQQKEEFARLMRKDFPVWYKQLPEWQQNDFSRYYDSANVHALSDNQALTIPNTLRTIPGLAHFSLHNLILRDQQGNTVECPRFHYATLSPLQIDDAEERQRLTKLNLSQLLEAPFRMMGERFLALWKPTIQPGQIFHYPILIQSLLSPIWPYTVAPWLNLHSNESRCLKEKDMAVQFFREKFASHRGVIEIRQGEQLYRLEPVLIATNHAIDFLRQETLLIESHTQKNSSEGAQLIRCVVSFIQDIVLPKFRAITQDESQSYHMQVMESLISQVLQSFIERDSLSFGFPSFLSPSNEIPVKETKSVRLEQIRQFSGMMRNKFQQAMNMSINAFNLHHIEEIMPKEAEPLRVAMTPEQLHQFRLLLNAVKDYIVLFNSRRNWMRHKEMFLSGLEAIITEKLSGLSSSSSLWNRDRKALQTLHTDAMLIYYEQYGILPTYRDDATNRRRFVEIFVDLFLTEHQQKHAGINAPGSEGIEHIVILPFAFAMNMLPLDILQEINRRHRNALKENADRAKLTTPANPNSWMASLLRLLQYNWSSLHQFFTTANEN